MTNGLILLTVNLTVESDRALAAAAQATGDTGTDTMNRAIQVYAALLNVFAQAGELWVKENGAAELVKLSINSLPECQ